MSAVRSTIRRIPRGKVATYGNVAEAAGFPGYHRQVAQLLKHASRDLPWHRVLGANGYIKTSAEIALEQRTRLEMEGVVFRGRRADMSACGYNFPSEK